MDNKFVKNGYNQIAETYLENRDSFKSLPFIDKLLEQLPSGSTILDLGCGAGKPVDTYIISKGYRVIGLDISEKQISLAQKLVPEGEYQVQDLSTLQPKQFSVDAIVSFYAIFHTSRETHAELFKMLKTYLPKKGLLLVTMGASDWEGTEDFHGVDMSWSHYDAETNASIIEDAGFNIIFQKIDTSGDEKHLVVLAEAT
ncbi:MAG: hypothetical protein QG639_491 [Patescibacteria group bacterium]|nr:hypothetical protein [Patescibacteria group bacterium]